MKIAVICDIHMPSGTDSIQHRFLMKALEHIRKDGITTIVSLGDISSCGETEAIEYYMSLMSSFDHHFVLGNAEVRNETSRQRILSWAEDFCLDINGRRIIGINTPFGRVEDEALLDSMNDGDILMMHHGIHALDNASAGAIARRMVSKNMTVIHAHSHRRFDYPLGSGRVIGLRALDPDKSVGDFPCITYLDITDCNVEVCDVNIEVSPRAIADASSFFGISCVDNRRDIEYALKNGVRYAELRCNGSWTPDYDIIPLIEDWRCETDGYLSVHMPNLKFSDGRIQGTDTWYDAVKYAVDVGARSLTIHPPRVLKADMPEGGKVWNDYLKLYLDAVNAVGDDVRVGIENLHMSDAEQLMDEDEIHFGYTPQEVSAFIDAINDSLGKEGRVGHVLDVGHARNNGMYSEYYPISRWYEIMGKRTVAYHIHQVVQGQNGYLNHYPIEGWFGPMISYASFFEAWDRKIINHAPVFLEVQGADSFEKSINAFNKTFIKGDQNNE